MGNLDRFIRTIIALNILFFYSRNLISGTVAIVLMVFAIIFLVTSLLAYCPLYSILGIHTNKPKSPKISD